MKGIDLFEIMDYIEDSYLEEALDDKFNYGQKKKKYWGRIAVSIAASLMLVFVGVVNMFPNVAIAMNDVLILGDLAKAVQIDQSMKACLENEYAQYIGESQVTKEGYYSQVYYMVTDASQVTIFYKTDVSVNGEEVYSYATVKGKNGESLECSIGWGITEIENLYKVTLEHLESIPEEIQLEICYAKPEKVEGEDGEIYWDREHENAFSKSVYQLSIDQQYRNVVTTYDIGKEVDINGFKMWVDRLDVYPTKAQLFFESGDDNSVILLDVDSVITDEKGREYEGTFGYTENDSGNIYLKEYDSTYFSSSDEFTIKIREAVWLAPEKRYGLISYEKKMIENMPEGVSIHTMELDEEGTLSLILRVFDEEWRMIGESGFPRSIETKEECEWGVYGDSEEGYVSRTDYDNPDYTLCGFTIYNYAENAYEMVWERGEKESLETPVCISVKKE